MRAFYAEVIEFQAIDTRRRKQHRPRGSFNVCSQPFGSTRRSGKLTDIAYATGAFFVLSFLEGSGYIDG